MEQPQEHSIFQEPEILKTLRPGPADSPPPNCAICLGICTNKCFTDCCLHQFCFNCLLEWSKIKAECPLCKQPFKSIIYNIKSNSEYEEHVIVNSGRENQDDLLEEYPSDFYLLPNGPRPQRHYEYRTTFTLEAGGEFTIQQLLRSHPRTNFIPFTGEDRMLSINTHSIYNRRNVYNNGLWVDPQPDLTGRYRHCTPTFFRSNPAQVHRIEPWLNRELSALMSFSVVYMVHEQILDLLRIVPIQCSAFRSCLLPHLGGNTDHFIHEFYNFVRSPFDMIGYDNCATYSRQRPPIFDLSDEDSDVLVVDSPSNNDCVYVPPRTPEVILIDSDDSDSNDVIIEEPIPPPIVDLLDSDDSDLVSSNCNNIIESVINTTVEDLDRTESRSPQLPIKIRLKRNRSSVEIRKNYKRNERKNRKRDRIDDSSDSDISSDSDLDNPIYSSSPDDSASTSSDSNYASSIDNRYSKSKSSKRKKSSKYKRHNKYDSKMKNSKSIKFKIYKKEKVEEKSKDSKVKRSKKSKKSKKSKRHNESSCSYKVKLSKRIKLENSDPSSSHSNNEYYSSSDDIGNKDKYSSSRTHFQIKYEINNKDSPCSDQEKSNLSDIPAASSSNNATDTSLNSPGANCLSNDAPASAQYVPNEAGPSNVPSLRSVVNVIVKNKGGDFWCCSSSPAFNNKTTSYRPDLRRKNCFDVVSDSD